MKTRNSKKEVHVVERKSGKHSPTAPALPVLLKVPVGNKVGARRGSEDRVDVRVLRGGKPDKPGGDECVERGHRDLGSFVVVCVCVLLGGFVRTRDNVSIPASLERVENKVDNY